MSLLIQYLVKLSISLSIVWLFYQFVLRRLTFYNSNRWYLLMYTLLSFFIPFINISFLFENGKSNDLVQLIPSVNQYTIALEEASHCPIPIWSTPYDKWDFLGFALITGATIFLLRFVKNFISFLRIRNKAELISPGAINIYQVNNDIIPFSFGNAVFINHNQHTTEELEEIVRHEFVHVKQKHTIDIIWAELLCILNWYNPFAWLLKRSIRQNLEFIADNKVIENGINKKEYQYLLLKVVGNSQFSIATQFNFSSLKKRIVMMNKTKSARKQLGRFLFLVPVFAIILLSFRKSFTALPDVRETPIPIAINDTTPGSTVLNSKGYYVRIIDDKGNCTVVVKDKNNKEIKRVLLTEWDANPHKYESLYGEIGKTADGVAVAVNAIKTKNPEIKTITVKGDIATVTLKNGKTETYTLSLKPERKAFEERCAILEVAMEPVEVDVELAEVTEEKLTTTAVESKEATVALSPVNVTNSKNSIQEVRVATNTKNSLNATNKVATTVAVSPLEESEIVEAITVTERRILNLGGLTVIDEGQYILLDNKEVKRDAYDKLRGPYRISFLDRSAAEKKYGEKGKNGAILLQTIH